MPTIVRMYNCAFGDCFRITHQDDNLNNVEHLYVDFGIHTRCGNEDWRNGRYDEIIEDIPNENVDFLLTHYHCDHYAGIIRMINQNHGPNRLFHRTFRNVYIPDVWNIADSINIVQLLLLCDVFTKSVLDNGLSLFRFLISICHANGRIYFIKRGRQIQNHYIALWPTEESVRDRAMVLWNTIAQQEDVPDYVQDILGVAERLCAIMNNISEAHNYEMRVNVLPQLEELEQEFLEIADRIPNDELLRKKLCEFKHGINIIFHNTVNHVENVGNDRNVLFTGDAKGTGDDRTGGGIQMWQYIIENRDGLVPFHNLYNVIKIPHHGTSRHYQNFTDISNNNTVYLIPNGEINNRRWWITGNYSVDANNHQCAVYCASNCACHAAPRNRCRCIRQNLVSVMPFQYVDI